MKNRNAKYILCILLISVIPLSIANVQAEESESWGLTTASSFEMTGGIDYNIQLPDSVWDGINALWLDLVNDTMMNGTIPGGETIDYKNLLAEMKNVVDTLINVEFNVESIYNDGETREEYLGFDGYEDIYEYYTTYYDMINFTMGGKLPADSTYEPFGNFTADWFENIGDWFNTSAYFPDSVGENLSAQIDGFTDMLEPTLNGEVPLCHWATSTNGSRTPNFLLEYGLSLDGYGGGPSSILFVPQDFSFERMYAMALGELEFVSGGTGVTAFVDAILKNYVVEAGLTNFDIREKELYAQFDFANVNGLLKSMMGLDELGEYIWGMVGPWNGSTPLDMFLEMMGGIGMDLDIDPASLDATAIIGIKYDEWGILENFHVELALSALNTTGGDPIIIELELDISSGANTEISAGFNGAPAALPPGEMTKDWGVTTGDIYEYTTGYELDVELPQTLWDIANDGLWNLLNLTYKSLYNTTYPDTETVDLEGILDAITTSIPSIYNLQLEVTDMDSVDLIMPHPEEGNPDLEVSYDIILTEIMAKLPEDVDYGSVEGIINDIITNDLPTILAALPPTLHANLTDLIGDLPILPENVIPAIPTILVTNPSAFDLSSMFLQTAPIASAGIEEPEVMMMSSALSMVLIQSLLQGMGNFGYFIPTDTDYTVVWDEIKVALGSMLNNVSIDEFITPYGLNLQIRPKWLYANFDLANMEPALADMLKLQMTSGEFPVVLDTSTLTLDATISIRWNEDGILQNSHMEVNAYVNSNEGPLSVNFLYDISAGVNTDLEEEFLGEPPAPIEIPGYSIEIISLSALLGLGVILLKSRKIKK